MNRSKVFVLGGLLSATLLMPALPALADPKGKSEHQERKIMGNTKAGKNIKPKNLTTTNMTDAITGIPTRASIIATFAMTTAAITTRPRFARTSKTCTAPAKRFHGDRVELRKDHTELRNDRAELRGIFATAPAKSEIMKDRQEIRGDLKEIHGDRVELRKDQGKLDAAATRAKERLGEANNSS